MNNCSRGILGGLSIPSEIVVGHPSHMFTSPSAKPAWKEGRLPWAPSAAPPQVGCPHGIVDEDVQPWLRAPRKAVAKASRGQTGQVQGHEDDFIVPTLLWSGKKWPVICTLFFLLPRHQILRAQLLLLTPSTKIYPRH